MDTIWMEGGVDYKMTLYSCIPTSAKEGLIEVVQDAETICSIQMKVRNGSSFMIYVLHTLFIYILLYSFVALLQVILLIYE